MLERLGLLRRDAATGLVAGAHKDLDRYFALALDERLRLCTRLWLGGGWWIERPDEREEPPGIRAPAHPRVATGRRQALQILLEAPTDSAFALEQLTVPVGQVTTRALSAERMGARARRRAAEPPTHDTVLTSLLGPLSWLGLGIRVAAWPTASTAPTLRVSTALDALRPAPAGAEPPRVREAQGRIIVQSTFEVVAYPPLAAPTLLSLDACADPIGVGAAARYQLTRAGLARARRRGWPPGEVSRRLLSLAGDVPQNVQVTLSDWERLADRVRVRTDLALLEVPTARLLDALGADRTLAQAMVRRTGPTTALIVASELTRVRAWLLRRGELPALVSTGVSTEVSTEVSTDATEPSDGTIAGHERLAEPLPARRQSRATLGVHAPRDQRQ
jgi:hypothetical protein